MKKTRSLTSLVAFVLFFACVLSCDEQEVKIGSIDQVNDANAQSASSKSDKPAPTFDGTEGAELDLATAKAWTANFRKASGKSDEILAHYFGKEIIENILSQSDCVGMRIYYALDEKGEKKLLLVGVDSSGDNILPKEGARTTDDDEEIIADFSFPCPDYCGGKGF
jgi:hypothetical protein